MRMESEHTSSLRSQSYRIFFWRLTKTRTRYETLRLDGMDGTNMRTNLKETEEKKILHIECKFYYEIEFDAVIALSLRLYTFQTSRCMQKLCNGID